ncbi:SAF domain-containing protein [Halobacillus litoralis]|uniref:SAF domain-containing protein n=1 Tax=Halobacillus litoralis TaxID=45668 RepID=A0A410MJC3_9BACI|nr:SAF domain-containing protein [Halobacillus litoralis]QAS54819.1 hypothetical protein HLI_21440 [Halobacillus litoralis]
MKPRTKIILGIFTSLLLLALIPTYDIFLKDKIDSTAVVVVKADTEIKTNQTIEPEMLSIERRRKQDLVDDVVLADEINDITGKEAAELLVSNSMVSKKMIDYEQMLPNPDEKEAIRPIVSDMIYAKPGSLRRKDNIDIYTISGDVTDKRMAETSEDTEDNEVSSEDVKKAEKEALKTPLLTNVRVVYVKDSANNEVTGEDGKVVAKGERLNATGNISDLEVILNEEDFNKLMKAVIEDNQKLYITYN